MLGAADGMEEAIGAALPPEEEARYAPLLSTIRAQLGDAAFAESWDAGRALPLEEAVAEALALADGFALDGCETRQ